MSRERIDPNKVRKFGDWYEENKEELNNKRKDRYDSDPEYRQQAKARTAEAYKKRNGILKDGKRIVKSGGVRFVVYKLSDAANILGININTLRWYYSSEYLPTFVVDHSSMKVITVDQIPLIKKFLKRVENDTVGNVSAEMKQYLSKHWRDRNGSKKEISNQEE